MNAPSKTAQVLLRDGDERLVDADQIRAFADTWTASGTAPADTAEDAEDERVTVLISGHSFEALPLIAAVLDVDTDLLRPHSALSALRSLGFTFEGQPQVHDHRLKGANEAASDFDDANIASNDTPNHKAAEGDNTDYDTYEELEDEVDPPLEPPTMTVELARSLQRHRGEWVAIRDNQLIGSASTLGDLRAQVGAGVISVLFVPRKPEEADE